MSKSRNDGTPSTPAASPFGMPHIHQELPEGATLEQQGVPISDLSPDNVLGVLRSKFPFLPILPFPSTARSVFLATANVAVDMEFPDSAALAVFRGNADYLISINGNAQVPSASQDPFSSHAGYSFFAPEGTYYYIYGLRGASFISPFANTYVTAQFWPIGLIR